MWDAKESEPEVMEEGPVVEYCYLVRAGLGKYGMSQLYLVHAERVKS